MSSKCPNPRPLGNYLDIFKLAQKVPAITELLAQQTHVHARICQHGDQLFSGHRITIFNNGVLYSNQEK